MRLADLPDAELIEYLVHERKFSQGGAERCVKNFRATMRFAKLDNTNDWDRQYRWEMAKRAAR